MKNLLKLDVAPGWKTNVTAITMALFNVSQVLGWEINETMYDAINGLLLSAIALFLSLKIRRQGRG